MFRAVDAFARESRASRPSRAPSPAVEAPTLQNHPQATSPPPLAESIPWHPQPSDAGSCAAHGSGQRPVASSVRHPSHLFDPLNLLGSGQPPTYPTVSAHSSFPSTLEEELHHFQHIHTRSHSDAVFHNSTSPFALTQSPLDVGFWGSIAQHFSSPRKSFLQATLDRHNVCMQSATQHVVELVSGVGTRVGFSHGFPRRTAQHSARDVDSVDMHSSPGVQDAFRAQATAPFRAATHTHSDVDAQTANASQQVADAVAAGQEESGGAVEGDARDVEGPTCDHDEASYSHPRFVATEERRSAVRSQLAGLRRKARLHAHG
jgi:hypothetical protein